MESAIDDSARSISERKARGIVVLMRNAWACLLRPVGYCERTNNYAMCLVIWRVPFAEGKWQEAITLL
jgi:hypothetical protein